MRERTRKFIGIILTFTFLLVYVLVMMVFGAALAAREPGFWVQLGYHAVAGVAWLPVVMWIIKWMSKPDTPARHDRQ